MLLVTELQPIQAHEVLGLLDTPSAKIIRRNADGLALPLILIGAIARTPFVF